MTITMNGLRQLTDAEAEAVTMHMQREHINAITARTGLSAAQVAAAVDQARVLAQASTAVPDTQVKPRHPAPVAFRAPTPAAEPVPVPVVDVEVKLPAAERGPRLTTSALLAWADEHGPSRARTLAARIRESAKELRSLHAGDTVRAEAAAEVERLTAELEAAKARLKEAGGKSKGLSTAVTPPDRKTELAAIRAWARADGREVSDHGQIRRNIVKAYYEAHGGTP